MRTQSAEIDLAMNQEIVFARLCTGFGMLALAIAASVCMGPRHTVWRGALAKSVSHGARRGTRRCCADDPGTGIVLAGIGLAIGLPAALGASTLLQSFLFGMKANDPLALTSAVAILLSAVVLAGYVPARNASRIDPVTALRNE